MECPNCGTTQVPEEARYCPNCSQPLEIAARVKLPQPAVHIRQEVEQNLGRVIGVQAGAIHGDVYGQGDIYQVQVYALGEEGRRAGGRHGWDAARPPYKFLSPYTALDRPVFKGRQAETEQLVRRIGEQSVLALYGQVGTGKTSLLAAGAIPELVQHGALVVHVQDYGQPLEATVRAALASSADRLSIDLPAEESLPALVQAVRDSTQGTLVLALDHFEKVFKESNRQKGLEDLLAGLEESLRRVEAEYLRVVFCLEEGALGLLAKFQERLPDLWRAPMQLLPFNHPQARAAIREPLGRPGEAFSYPVYYEAGLIDELLLPDLDDLTPAQPGRIQPTHLQIVCHWLYEAALQRDPPVIDRKLYIEQARGADGILARYLEDTLQTSLAADRVLAEEILLAMASPGSGEWSDPQHGSRNGAPPERTGDTLTRLVEAGLLVRRTANGNSQFAFASPVLAEEVRRIAGPEVSRRYQATEELERIWKRWLSHDALATRGQLRYLAAAESHLAPHPVKSLLMLRSALARELPASPWYERLALQPAADLVRRLEGLPESGQGNPAMAGEAMAASGGPSALSKAAQLLGLSGISPGVEDPASSSAYGPLAWLAVSHEDRVTRQAAVLALAAAGRFEALDRLDWALRSAQPGFKRLARKAELRGALAEADPEIGGLNRHLAFIERGGVWLWRVASRLRIDRQRIAMLAAGGALGAGLGLGLLRALTAWAARFTPGLHASQNFFFGAVLGASLIIGRLLVEYISLSPDGFSPAGRKTERTRLPGHWQSLVAALLGALAFGVAHTWVALASGELSFSGKEAVLGMGLVAGLVLSVALFRLPWPRNQAHLAAGRWPARLSIAAIGLAMVHSAFLLLGDSGRSISIVWPGSKYRAEFSRYANLPVIGDIMRSAPGWFNLAALADAALVGIVLSVGTGAGLQLAARTLERWRSLVDRYGD